MWRADMKNVSDAGVKALAEAGCGCGLRTIILGAVCSVPSVRIVGVGLRFCTVTCFSLSVFFFLFVVVIALPRNALVAMNLGMAGIVCCDVVWR